MLYAKCCVHNISCGQIHSYLFTLRFALENLMIIFIYVPEDSVIFFLICSFPYPYCNVQYSQIPLLCVLSIRNPGLFFADGKFFHSLLHNPSIHSWTPFFNHHSSIIVSLSLLESICLSSSPRLQALNSFDYGRTQFTSLFYGFFTFCIHSGKNFQSISNI